MWDVLCRDLYAHIFQNYYVGLCTKFTARDTKLNTFRESNRSDVCSITEFKRKLFSNICYLTLNRHHLDIHLPATGKKKIEFIN